MASFNQVPLSQAPLVLQGFGLSAGNNAALATSSPNPVSIKTIQYFPGLEGSKLTSFAQTPTIAPTWRRNKGIVGE
jgi:hypothetical protein